MKIVIIFLSLLIFQTLQAEELNCLKIYLDTKRSLSQMRENYKLNADVEEDFLNYEELSKQIKKCPAYKKDKAIKVSDKEIAAFRKSIYAPDTSANIPEKSCTEMRIDTTHMPDNRNQGNLNWCFAYTSADLLSFQEGVKVSAYDIALQNHNNEEIRQLALDQNIKDFSQAGGWPIYAMLAVTSGNKGVCHEVETNYTNGKWEELSHIFSEFAGPDKDFFTVICDHKLNDTMPFKNIPTGILEIINELSGDAKMSAFLDVSCNRHQLKNKYSLYSLTNEQVDPLKLMGNIDGLLNKGLPISIGYAGELIDFGVNYKGKKSNHASTVIGRKFNKLSGQCEYLLRNSWGAGGKCQRTSSISCENGNFWVPRTALKNNLFEVMWMEKKAKP
jgi:hypothetical protein